MSTVLFLLVGCSPKETSDKVINIASHTEPMTTVIEIAAKQLEEEGYEVNLIVERLLISSIKGYKKAH